MEWARILAYAPVQYPDSLTLTGLHATKIAPRPPSPARLDRLTRVAPAFLGKPVLSAEQIEDVVAAAHGGCDPAQS
jgi:hypothetical protein